MKKVKDEKEELRRQLAELEMREKVLTETVQGKNVYDGLQAKRIAKKATTNTPISTMLDEDQGVGSVWKNLQGTYVSASTARLSAKGTSRASSSAAGASSSSGSGVAALSTTSGAVRVVTPTGQQYVMAGITDLKKKGKDSMELTRRNMYDLQVVKGVLEPGPRAKFEASRLKEQAKCLHLYEDLRWGANAMHMYASCKECGLKSVILYEK